MTTKYIPAWQDQKGNRFVTLARNHVFDSLDDLNLWKLTHALEYAVWGWIPDGHIQIELSDDGNGTIPYVPANGPFGSKLAIIGGPLFETISSGENDSQLIP